VIASQHRELRFVVLELPRGLSPEILANIAALETDSVSADGGRLKLEWSILNARSGDAVDDILWWEDGRLTGFLGLYAFGGPDVELAGMVHPQSRRRGIGTRLLDEALELCRERGHQKILLVVPRVSAGGRALAESRRGFLDHSEHALDLIGPATEGPSDPSLLLRPETRDDLAEEARILAGAFGDTGEAEFLETPNESRMVGERDGSVVATLRVYRFPEHWGIYGLAVDTQYRGMGIGRDLLRRVSREAQANGVTRLHLEVEVDNDEALGLYTSLGFTQTSTEDYFDIPLQ
jgi:ribosomal protein S18 acetylase RimI-like enzyme